MKNIVNPPIVVTVANKQRALLFVVQHVVVCGCVASASESVPSSYRQVSQFRN